MQTEDLYLAAGKHVKIVLQNDFVLWGTIEKVNTESIFFKSSKESSIIDQKEIKMVIIKEGY